MDDTELTVGAAFVVGWILGGAFTLTIIRLTLKLVGRDDEGPPDQASP
jgi:hypothetical protein